MLNWCDGTLLCPLALQFLQDTARSNPTPPAKRARRTSRTACPRCIRWRCTGRRGTPAREGRNITGFEYGLLLSGDPSGTMQRFTYAPYDRRRYQPLALAAGELGGAGAM